MGYAGSIGFASNSMAELWGIREGLKVAAALDIAMLIVELDSLVAVTLLQQKTEDVHPLATLIEDYHLANLAEERDIQFVSFDEPPISISSLLLGDVMGAMTSC
ncbi:hypothetical protein Syun_012327 [Stephania yunnanensis]|uniref:RNase H type-1 domain-containing protein n=1 Tax=Stephania yunnanensis TaxID=152371 RepID=A0AAP0PGB0_9MAGN